MKYIVWNAVNNDMICCDSRASAEELILSIAEEEAFGDCNYGINKLEDEDTLEEYIDLLRGLWHKENLNNECICLYLGGFNFYIKEIYDLED